MSRNLSNFTNETIQNEFKKLMEQLGIEYTKPKTTAYHSNINCINCDRYVRSLDQIKKKIQSSLKREKQLKRLLNRFEIQSNHMMESNDNTIRDFSQYILKLEDQLQQRDELINKLCYNLDYLHEKNNTLEQLLKQQRKKVEEMEKLSQDKVSIMELEIKELKSHILRQISQKASIERKHKSQSRKISQEKYYLKQQVKSLQQQIVSKQKLIKYLSNSNNQLRMQLIQLKAKAQIDETTWITQKKKENINQSNLLNLEINKLSENDNQGLLNQSLQNQLNNFMKETSRTFASTKHNMENGQNQNHIQKSKFKRKIGGICQNHHNNLCTDNIN